MQNDSTVWCVTMKRVGITSDPERRKKEHQNKYPDFRNWQIRAERLSYGQAQEKEDEYKREGYEGSPGGQKKEGNVYSVYTFES